jgi:cobalt-zinc-cadmium efflux system protein
MTAAESSQIFEFRTVNRKKLLFSLSITATVMIIEFVGGFLTNSIALISDGWHMFTHCFAISLALVAIIIAAKPPCHHRTFGLYRAEILAAFVNGMFLIIIVIIIIIDAIQRVINPVDVLGFEMMIIAFVGLFVNLTSIGILHGSHDKDINIRSVFYHMIVDAVSSVGVLIAAIVIYFTDWFIIDPLISFGIAIVIIYWAVGIIRESTVILLEMTPAGVNIDDIGSDLKKRFPAIKEIVSIHCWTLTTNMIVFTAHIDVQPQVERDKLINEINEYLTKNYNVIESTIQVTKGGVTTSCFFPQPP